METHGNLPSQNFASLFNCWFNSDLIDVSNHAEAISLAGTVVADLMQKGTPAQEIIGPSTGALAHWGPAAVDEFSNASDGDWSLNADTENLLKDIVREMIVAARRREEQATALKLGDGQAT